MLEQEVRSMTINNVVGNFVGHAGITYWIKHKLEGIQAWGVEGYIADFITTGFLFCAIIAAIFIFWFRKRMAMGEFDASTLQANPSLIRLPANAWLATLTIGLLGLVSVAVPLAAYLAIVGSQPLTPAAVSLTKGIWAALAAAVIVPMAIYHGVNTAALE